MHWLEAFERPRRGNQTLPMIQKGKKECGKVICIGTKATLKQAMNSESIKKSEEVKNSGKAKFSGGSKRKVEFYSK